MECYRIAASTTRKDSSVPNLGVEGGGSERESENEIKKEKRKSFVGYTRVLKYLSRIRKVGKKRSFPVIVTREGKNVEIRREALIEQLVKIDRERERKREKKDTVRIEQGDTRGGLVQWHRGAFPFRRKHLPFGDLCESSRYAAPRRQLTTARDSFYCFTRSPLGVISRRLPGTRPSWLEFVGNYVKASLLHAFYSRKRERCVYR